jgi:hypothetical protein
MQPSSIFCRAQEARHYEAATGTGLANVKSIAARAAAAWAKEALSAEKREKRLLLRQPAPKSAEAFNLEMPTEERSLSENPDRGFADLERGHLVAGDAGPMAAH